MIRSQSGLSAAVCLLAGGLMLPETIQAHEAHMLIGHTASGQLTFNTTDGVQADAMTVLALIPPGGLIEGYSASVPGFSLVLDAVPTVDCYPLAEGADVWVEFLVIDMPLLIIETPSYLIINEKDPPEVRIGGEATAHVHPLWLLDIQDPAYDPLQCTWEASFILKDKGGTAYDTSEVYTFRFAAGEFPCPADFDCDRDVDSDDFALFEGCTSGPAVSEGPLSPPLGCSQFPNHQGVIAADLDRDDDVDLADFAQLQVCCQGAGVDCDPECVESA